jgi:hypothetical protein
VVEFISELAAPVNPVRQSHHTLTDYGFVKTAAEDFAIAAMLVGISRIFPNAQALNFDAVWNGYVFARAHPHGSPELKGVSIA